ncbi:MAG: 30S ribosomal protein S9 [Patescibacteria group bacterium]
MTVKLAKYYEGVGKRKEAIARVRLIEDGKSHFTVNDVPLEKAFPTEIMRRYAQVVLEKNTSAGKLSVSARVAGGGRNAQAEAVALGLARALVVMTPELRTTMRQGKHLTRDARIKERRKFGLKKARKAPQWSKR